MSCWTKEELENMLEDVVTKLILSEGAIEKHGPLGTAPAQLVRLVLEEKDFKINALKRGVKDVGGTASKQVGATTKKDDKKGEQMRKKETKTSNGAPVAVGCLYRREDGVVATVCNLDAENSIVYYYIPGGQLCAATYADAAKWTLTVKKGAVKPEAVRDTPPSYEDWADVKAAEEMRNSDKGRDELADAVLEFLELFDF